MKYLITLSATFNILVNNTNAKPNIVVTNVYIKRSQLKILTAGLFINWAPKISAYPTKFTFKQVVAILYEWLSPGPS